MEDFKCHLIGGTELLARQLHLKRSVIIRTLRRGKQAVTFIRREVFEINDFLAFSRLIPCFCVGCHNNRGIKRVVAQARVKLALAQCEFASCGS